MKLLKITTFISLLTVLCPAWTMSFFNPIINHPKFDHEKIYTIDVAKDNYKRGISCILGEFKNKEKHDTELLMKRNRRIEGRKSINFHNDVAERCDCTIKTITEGENDTHINATVTISKLLLPTLAIPLQKQAATIIVPNLTHTARIGSCTFQEPYITWQAWTGLSFSLGAIAYSVWRKINS